MKPAPPFTVYSLPRSAHTHMKGLYIRPLRSPKQVTFLPTLSIKYQPWLVVKLRMLVFNLSKWVRIRFGGARHGLSRVAGPSMAEAPLLHCTPLVQHILIMRTFRIALERVSCVMRMTSRLLYVTCLTFRDRIQRKNVVWHSFKSYFSPVLFN